MTIQENVKNIAEELKKINSSASIIAASKTRSIEEIRACMETGLVLGVGENRVQEFREKFTPDFRWDFIGRLQTNKVKYIVGKADTIHSMDRIALAEEIQRECQKKDVKQKVLIEINSGEEESKGGIRLDELDAFSDELSKFDRIIVSGLMAVAPVFYSEEELEKTFDNVYNAFFKRKTDVFSVLSMGMSNDYLIAAKCGANVVRPGRAIFGERNYAPKE